MDSRDQQAIHLFLKTSCINSVSNTFRTQGTTPWRNSSVKTHYTQTRLISQEYVYPSDQIRFEQVDFHTSECATTSTNEFIYTVLHLIFENSSSWRFNLLFSPEFSFFLTIVVVAVCQVRDRFPVNYIAFDGVKYS